MGYIIAIVLFMVIYKKYKENIKFIGSLVLLLIGGVILFKILRVLLRFYIAILFLIGLFAVFAIYGGIVERRKFKEWYSRKIKNIDDVELDRIFMDSIDMLKEGDSNISDYKFDAFNLPYGRVNAFLNYFDSSIQNEEIYYYSSTKSMDNNEIREYGMCVTQSGIFISNQYGTKKSIREISKFIPYKGLMSIEERGNKIAITYANTERIGCKYISFPIDRITINPSNIIQFVERLIKKDIPLIYFKEEVYINESRYLSVEEAEERFFSDLQKSNIEDMTSTAGLMGAGKGMVDSFKETGRYMDGARGGGYAAEYGNNTIDRVLGRKVSNEAQNLDPITGRQIKHGADRVVSGKQIQTKYYKTAPETIGAAFKSGQSIYNDGSSMMQIEVPRDQYQEALRLMKRRIDNGQVKGAKPGDSPERYVRKGHYTYYQANNIAISGTIESLTVDVLSGAVICTQAAGISAIIAFSVAIWNGESPKDAAIVGLSTGMKVLGQGTLIYTLSMQLSRERLINPFVQQLSTADGIAKSVGHVKNPIYNTTQRLTESIKSSELAKSNFGKAMGLNKIQGQTVVAGGITTAVVFGPDICRTLSGRISKQQLAKNSTIGASGIGGGFIGQALIPIPIVGATIGAGVSSFIAKKTLDNFIEDDSILMFQVLKEEFLDVVMVSDLTQEEFENVVSKTIAYKRLPKLLMDMYQSNDFRCFAREAIVSVAVRNIMAQRDRIMDEDIEMSYEVLLNTSI